MISMPSREQIKFFLAVLQRGYSIAGAAAAIGITRQQALDLRAKDPAFAADWDNALETAVDALEDLAIKRAKARMTSCWNCC